ncbi:hypothetical protein CPB86DRAFT_828776, partial [Serendipita vermifera]
MSGVAAYGQRRASLVNETVATTGLSAYPSAHPIGFGFAVTGFRALKRKGYRKVDAALTGTFNAWLVASHCPLPLIQESPSPLLSQCHGHPLTWTPQQQPSSHLFTFEVTFRLSIVSIHSSPRPRSPPTKRKSTMSDTGKNGHRVLDDNEADYFSSPLASPSIQTPRSLPAEPSLGIYFAADEGESNDVIAALRASQRVIREAAENLLSIRPRTDKNQKIASMLRVQEREFAQWVSSGLAIDSSRQLSIKSLPLFEKLAKYVNKLQDLEADFPAPSSPTSKLGLLLRRFSSSTSSQSSQSNKNSELGEHRLTVASEKILKRFVQLEESINEFREEQTRRSTAWHLANRAREDLKIPHSLCLPGTRVEAISSILDWSQSVPMSPISTPVQADSKITSEPESTDKHLPILCVLGDQGTGKSAVLATVACEWKRSGSLLSTTFLLSNQEGGTTVKEEDSHQEQAPPNLGRTKSMMARLTQRRMSPARRKRSQSLLVDTTQVSACLEGAKGSFKALVVDGLDHVPPIVAVRMVKETLDLAKGHSNLRVLLSAKSMSSTWLKMLSGETIHFLSLDSSSDGKLFSQEVDLEAEAPKEEGNEDEASRAPVDNANSNISHYMLQDFATFVSSRLCLALSPTDQARIVQAANGNFATLSRLCREVVEAGANERVLDGVLYREKVRTHGEGI